MYRSERPLPLRPEIAVRVAGGGFLVAAVSGVYALGMVAIGVLGSGREAFLPWILGALSAGVSYATGVGSLRLLDGRRGLLLLRSGLIGAVVDVWLVTIRSARVDSGPDTLVFELPDIVIAVVLTLVLVGIMSLSFSRKIARWLAPLAAWNTASGIGR